MRDTITTIAAAIALCATTAAVEAATVAPTPRPDRAAPIEAVGPLAALTPAARPATPRVAAAATVDAAATRRETAAPTPRPSRAAAAVAAAAAPAPAVAFSPAAEALDAIKAAPTPRPAAARSRAALAPERAEVTPAALSPRARDGFGVGPGGLCGDARLSGTPVPTVVGVGACGIEQPVRVMAVAGVSLGKPVTVGCGVARRFADWVESSARPAARQLGSELVSIDTFAGYSCRPRNNRPGARMSLHGLGKAIDVGGFRLADGRAITVSDHWRGAGDKSAFLKSVWRSACGPFGTVLGPGSDGHHENHLHFDVAQRRTPYCR
jgi:hypothetical protein